MRSENHAGNTHTVDTRTQSGSKKKKRKENMIIFTRRQLGRIEGIESRWTDVWYRRVRKRIKKKRSFVEGKAVSGER